MSTEKELWARMTKLSINHEAEVLLGRRMVLYWPKEHRR